MIIYDNLCCCCCRCCAGGGGGGCGCGGRRLGTTINSKRTDFITLQADTDVIFTTSVSMFSLIFYRKGTPRVAFVASFI